MVVITGLRNAKVHAAVDILGHLLALAEQVQAVTGQNIEVF